MLSFKEYLELNEDLITFGKKAYPKFGNAIILAGGAGSGKGFVIEQLFGIEARVIDTDDLKKKAIESTSHLKNALLKYSKIQNHNLKNPEHTTDIHAAVKQIGIEKKQKDSIKNALQSATYLPNIIIDTTLSSFEKFEETVAYLKAIGYDPQNIHLVWVINDYVVARQNNLKRERTVSDEVMRSTHTGAKETMSQIYQISSGITKYMDGDIWYVFNKPGVDSTLQFSNKGRKVLTKANYFKLKSAGSSTINKIPNNSNQKIKKYTKIR